jgi:heme A synthase
MQRPGAGGGLGELRSFRRLADIAVLATLALIIVGGIVRVSDSGLGCGPGGSGTEGWPLCDGRVLPLIDATTLVEFSHRMLATVVVVLIGLLGLRGYRGLRDLRWPLRGSLAAGALVLVQAVLGGLTVEHNLEDELVAAHLGLAMLLLALLLWLDVSARRAEGSLPVEAIPRRRLRPVSTVAAVLLLSAIVAGGYVAGTEKEGAGGAPVVNGAHAACGEQFPGCLNEGMLPFGESRLVDIHLTHRLLVYAATAAILALLGLALASGVRSRLILIAAALLVFQLSLGAANVWLGKHAGLILAHLTLGTIVWATAVYAWTTLMPVPAPRSERLRGAEPVTRALAA